jgi:adenylate cyclase
MSRQASARCRMMNAWLENSEGKQLPLHGACLIGRSSACQIVIADACISRRHSLIQQQNDDEFWLVDLGSSNGTRLNGKRLSQPCRLKVRDTIRIHTHEFSFRVSAPRPHSATTSVGLHAQATQLIANIESVNCWLLLADIDGSTRLSQEVPADEWPQIVGSWLLHCRDEIEAVGGTVNKYLGDGLFAYLVEAPDAPERIRQLIAQLAALQLQHKPPFHVVLHYGSIAMGGASASGEESLLGPEVNFAFRLEKLAGKLGAPIGMSAKAAALWPDRSELVSFGSHPVPGFDGKYEILGFKNPDAPASSALSTKTIRHVGS